MKKNLITPVTPLTDQGYVAQTAFVVFCGQSDVWWLRGLKKGFRHCFVILQDGQHTVAVDPLSCFTEVIVQSASASIGLPRWYESLGLTVVPAVIDRSVRHVQWPGPFTCVESVKRILGLRAPWILTPWQLHQYLRHHPSPISISSRS